MAALAHDTERPQAPDPDHGTPDALPHRSKPATEADSSQSHPTSDSTDPDTPIAPAAYRNPSPSPHSNLRLRRQAPHSDSQPAPSVPAPQNAHPQTTTTDHCPASTGAAKNISHNIAAEASYPDQPDPHLQPRKTQKHQPHSVTNQQIGEPLKNENYFIVFPEALDLVLQEFDDRLIRITQWRTDGGVYLFSWFFTALTSIEAALPLPFIFFLAGYDTAATILATILTSLGFFSQLPKRFLWRTRPWMNGRAKIVRKDRTSSFPSRGVICGIVFPVSLLYAYERETGRDVHLLLYFLSTSCCVLCTSFARVNVGAHYPSDIVAGVFVGGLVQMLGFWSLRFWDLIGAPIQPSAMYAADPSHIIQLHSLIYQTPPLLLTIAIVSSYSVTWVCIQGFWQKCNYVFGMLFSCLAFRFVYLNPLVSSAAVSVPPASAASWFKCCLWGGVILAYGMKTRGKKGHWRVANFILIFHLSFALLVWNRL